MDLWDLFLSSIGPIALAGLTGTIPLALISFGLGLVLALGAALMRISEHRILSGIARVYISIIRRTPLLVQLFVSKGQREAAYTVGMGCSRALTRIILPQAARVSVPPLSNTFISLVKDTSLASLILVTELFRTAQQIAAFSYKFMVIYLTAALVYWVICLVLSLGQDAVVKRLDRPQSVPAPDRAWTTSSKGPGACSAGPRRKSSPKRGDCWRASDSPTKRTLTRTSFPEVSSNASASSELWRCVLICCRSTSRRVHLTPSWWARFSWSSKSSLTRGGRWSSSRTSSHSPEKPLIMCSSSMVVSS